MELLGLHSFPTRRSSDLGLEADRERAEGYVEQSLAMGTALVPEIGYERAAALVKEAYATGKTVREVAREKSGIGEERLRELLEDRKSTRLNSSHGSISYA